LVENSTGIVKDQEFDEHIRIYEEENKKIIIVENDNENHEIQIMK
jgi:hypothetical protein